MIEVKNISFKYAGQKDLVFDDFSLELRQDNIYGLLGKNGTGKSTLLYLISGLLRAKKGSVCFDGIETYKRLPETLSEIFIVPEEFDLPAMSLDEYVKINRLFYPLFSTQVLEACLKDFELTSDVKLNALSMGQKKKVFMAFALATNTKVLLMDEPTNGLDIPSKSQFRDTVYERRPHPDHLHPSGARCGVTLGPHPDSLATEAVVECQCGRDSREIYLRISHAC